LQYREELFSLHILISFVNLIRYLASTGGLLGLCLGVSVLSAIEAIYYCTLRLFWKLRYRERTVQTMVKKFTEILKRKIRRPEDDNVKNNFLINERASMRRLNDGFPLNPQNGQGMYHLNNQLFLRNNSRSRGLNLNGDNSGQQHYQSYVDSPY